MSESVSHGSKAKPVEDGHTHTTFIKGFIVRNKLIHVIVI